MPTGIARAHRPVEPPSLETCQPECLFPTLIAQGDHSNAVVTGPKPPGRDATLEVTDGPQVTREQPWRVDPLKAGFDDAGPNQARDVGL
jgi:hypothetical protein